MEASSETRIVTLELPQVDMKLLTAISKKMGWKKKVQRTSSRKSGIDIALDDIKKGNTRSFNSMDSLSEYLNS